MNLLHRLLIMSVWSILLVFPGCTDSQRKVFSKKGSVGQKHIYILPLGKIDQKTVLVISDSLQKRFSKVTVLPKEDFPKTALYKPRMRYRADSLLKWLKPRVGRNETYLGITSEDISVTKGGIADFGVMGLGSLVNNVCVASSYRLKDKKSFFKVVIHELGHTSGLPHCSNESCYMRDAKGGDVTRYEVDFCTKCKDYLNSKGWRT